MCALFGFVDTSGTISNKVKQRLLNSLSISSECRGSDATGISFVMNGNIHIFKTPKPAHRVRLRCPSNTIALSGHTRAATSGPASLWWNNHPFKGIIGDTAFSLSHNGIIWNVSQLRKEFSLNQTKIETDSYVCVQLIEHFGRLNFESLKQMAEAISGSYTITVLDDRNNIFIVRGENPIDRNNIFIVRGENPIELIHLEKLGLFVFASTGSILERALKKCKLSHVKFDKIPIKEGEIIKLSAGGEIERSSFSLPLIYPWSSYCSLPLSYNTLKPYGVNSSLHELLEIAQILNVSTNEVQDALDSGFSVDEILEMLESPNAPNNHLDFIELECNDDFEL